MTRITGLIVPWDVVGDLTVGGRAVSLRFARGTLQVPADPSRVKLLVDHDRGRCVGYGISFDETGEGLVGTFEVADPAVVDQIAGRLVDGLSPGLDLNEATRQRANRGQVAADGALLREVSLVSVPAFVNAVATIVPEDS